MKFIKSFSSVKGRFFLSLCFFLTLNDLTGQYYQSNQSPYNISDGLPHNEINEIVKDKSGFVWIATENGLSRYDGYNFVNFNSTTHPGIFKDNRIKSLMLNGKFLYLLTNGDGLIKLDTKNLQFLKIYSSPPLSMAFSGDTTAILLATGDLIVNLKNKILASRHFNVSQKDNIILHKGNVYLSLSNKGILKMPVTKLTKQTLIDIPGEKHGKLLLSKKYGIIHHNGYLVRILRNDVIVDHPEFKGNRKISFFQEDESGLAIYIENYRTLFVKNKQAYLGLTFGESDNFQLKQICRINKSCLLIASNQGVVKISVNPALIESVDDYNLSKENEIIVRRSILEREGKRYFLSYPNIIEQSNKLTPLTKTILPISDGILIDNDLYCATDGNGLISVDLTSKKIKNHIGPFMGPTEYFEDISIYSKNSIILTGGNKVVLYNPKTSKVSVYYLEKGTVVHIAIQKKNSNLIYLGTNNGVFRVRVNADEKIEMVDFIGKSDLDVRDILFREEQNEMWLATNNGVFVMDLRKSKITKSYTQVNQVSHPKVVKLLEDKNGCIWASTYLGITVYNTKRGTIQFLNKNHGLKNNEFNYKSGYLLENGMMIFGGLNAYDIINPKLLSEFTYVTSFQISGIEKLDNQGKKTFLNYNENEIIKSTTGEVIKVYLTNFDFHFGKGYIFQYSIDSKNWFKTDNNQTFLLSNLAYGDYVLKIRMFNPFGQLVTEKTFQLQIDTSFYYRTEFYVLIIILILLLSILFILFLIRSIRVKTKTRSKIAMDLHDESGTILTRLLLLSKKEKFDDQDIERLRNGLKEALYNFRTYLDVLSRKKHSWQDLTDEIQEFIHQICTDSNVSYKFINDFDDDQIIKRELFRDIKLTTYEVITNSLKYSRSKTLTIQFLLKENNFKMIISDFGTFHITDLDERKGNGLRNIKKRVTRNKGCYSYYNTSELGGITVEINMPIK